MLNPLEIVERQTEIIKIQSDAIDELFILLMQHIGAQEADRLPVIAKINQAAEIRREIE
jgi:hypothetical protein